LTLPLIGLEPIRRKSELFESSVFTIPPQRLFLSILPFFSGRKEIFLKLLCFVKELDQKISFIPKPFFSEKKRNSLTGFEPIQEFSLK
jgi:hypothetical protein